MDRAAVEDWVRAHVEPGVPSRPHTSGRGRRCCGCRWPAGPRHRIPDTVQHDDLHMANLYLRDGRARVLDWGDASISHPFASLVVTFRFLEQVTRLPPGDPWFARLRDAYLEPWGSGLTEAFALGMRVGAFAHSIAWARQRDHLTEDDRADFDRAYRIVLRRAVAHTRQRRPNSQ